MKPSEMYSVFALACNIIIHTYIYVHMWSQPVTIHIKKSCTRRNFAVNMVREMFDDDTMKHLNVAGKLRKLMALIEYTYFNTNQYNHLKRRKWDGLIV